MDESHATLPVPTRTRRGEREAEQTYTGEAAQVSGLLSCTICFFPLGHRRRLRPRLPQAHLARQRPCIGFPPGCTPHFVRPAIVLKCSRARSSSELAAGALRQTSGHQHAKRACPLGRPCWSMVSSARASNCVPARRCARLTAQSPARFVRGLRRLRWLRQPGASGSSFASSWQSMRSNGQ